MNLFDPYHCRVARDLVAKGQHLDAVRLLSQSPDRDHRAARQLLAECQPRLIESIGQSAEAMLWDRAAELLEAAALCGELPVEAVALKDRVLAGQRRAHEQAQRLEQARDWARQGRVVSALDLLRPLEGHADAAGRDARVVLDVQADLEERLSRGERYLAEAAELLDRGLLPAARDRLDRARETHANHPRLAALEERHRRVLAEQSPLPVAVPQPAAPDRLPPLVSFVTPTAPVGWTPRPSESCRLGTPARHNRHDGQECPSYDERARTDGTSILRGEAHVPSRFLINDELLVITTEEAVIGNARGRGVNVPLLANVHSRHALIVRHRRDYQLVGLPNCTTLVNGEPLTGTRLLTDGDIIQFGPPGCLWRFLCPVPHSATAIFESVGSLASSIPLPSEDARQIHCQRFVMLADELVLTPGDDGHYSLPELPARELRLQASPTGITLLATEAVVFVERSDNNERLDDAPLNWPSRLLIRTTLDETELLRRSLLGQPTPDEMPLTLREV